jgi:molybdopterin/thiamine biosynthesis adenylyltransferase
MKVSQRQKTTYRPQYLPRSPQTAMKRMATSNVLIVGVKGLGVEIGK